MSNGTLSDIRVLDLSRVLSGPFATMHLGDLGADVWKVEPKEGDPSRDLSPPLIHGESAYYQSVNRNKRSLRIDFRHKDAPALLLRLAEKADVVVENFLPKVKHKLGIDYDAVRKVNPEVIYCSISGFGQSGPYSDRPGLDNIFQGMAGLMAVTGIDDRPVKAGERVGDMVTGLNAALAIVAAIRARDRDGNGQFLDLALVDCLVALQAPQISNYLATGEQTPKVGNGSFFSAPTDTFQTADRPINICVMSNKHWLILCKAMGEEDGWAVDPAFATNADRVSHRDIINDHLAARFLEHSADHWLTLLGDAGVPVGPVLSYPEIFADPQVLHNGLRTSLPDAKGRDVPMIDIPVTYGRPTASLRSPPPRLGEHGAAILSDAGLSACDMQDALASGLVMEGPDNS
ncbi:CaiB/BaiF CoA transferase family protein [Roseovarius sp. ZX-A-9]|uniref:CaiB/BaiF CoA transferase family protein n=1 Tax=Roseovarius sp. ZX-A-9 TaxID=3014783 RepID=UPI00232F0E06|nr:CoA transferase [Roseovarius sp. ZX-A-9]